MKDIQSGSYWRMSKEEEGVDGGLALQESKPELKKPPLFKVILINDDYTPMEFVVEVVDDDFGGLGVGAKLGFVHAKNREPFRCGLEVRDPRTHQVEDVP